MKRTLGPQDRPCRFDALTDLVSLANSVIWQMDIADQTIPTTTMKKPIWISILAIPFLFVACQPKETVKEKMDAGAEKVAEGVKEMADAAGQEAAKAGEKVKDAVADEAAKAKAAAEEATANMKKQDADAAAAGAAAVDKAADNVKDAVNDAKEAVKEAAPE